MESLPPFASLANETTRLNREVDDLKTDAEDTSEEIDLALDDARLRKADAEKVNYAHRDKPPRIRLPNKDGHKQRRFLDRRKLQQETL